MVAAGATSTVVEERTALGDDWLEARWADPDGAPVPGARRADRASLWAGSQRVPGLLVGNAPPTRRRDGAGRARAVAYVHNYALPGERFRWDGIGELYERSLALAAERGTWFASEAAAPLVADELNFMVPSTRVILTTDHRVVIA